MLHYGGTRLIDKVMAFLWALHLIVGPTQRMMRYFIDKIASITTDMGIEKRIPGIPNILGSFLLRLGGVAMDKLAGTVDAKTRLFEFSMRISGWSHMYGNIMAKCCKSIAMWPRILQNLRTLCKFFKLQHWRDKIAVALKGRYPEVTGLMKSFTASFAKWRYETTYTVFSNWPSFVFYAKRI